LSIYTDSIALIEGAIPVLHIVSGAAILLGGGFIFFSGVSGTGKTQISLTIEIITIMLYLTAAYMLVIEWQADITAVWSTEFIYAFLLGSLSWLYLKSGKWRKARV
jgi:Na+-driven multidrug efflux pump